MNKELTRDEFVEELIKRLKELPDEMDFIYGDQLTIITKKNRADLRDLKHYLLWNDSGYVKISEIPENLHFQLIFLCIILGYEDETMFDLTDIDTLEFLNEEKRKMAMSSSANLSDRLLYHFIEQTMERLRREQEKL